MPGHYQIGDHLFLSAGFPEPVKERPLLMDRPGVEGSAIWLTGQRGKRYTVITKTDAHNLDHATELFAQYRALIGADPVEMIWAGLPMTNETTKIAVLDVRTAPGYPVRMAAATPSLFPPSLGYIECEWDLVTIPIEEEEP